MEGFICVLDCSVTMSWLFEDEVTSYSERILDALGKGANALVPSLWPLEVGNVLLMAERRKRLTPAQSTAFKAALSELGIQVDSDTHKRALDGTIDIARDQHLTLYDATYLELAMRNALPLATFDKPLIKAAKRVGVHLFKP